MAWRLVPPFEEEEVIQAWPSLRITLRKGISAFGDAAPLTLQRDPSAEQEEGATYFFGGGRVHETDDPAIRQLWLDSGLEVEVV